MPAELQTALDALYGHYEKTFELWDEAGISVPPVFIVVCNNTSTSKLVYDFISGFNRENDDGSTTLENGRLALFRNYDEHGNRLPRPRTLLIDSEQLESGEALDTEFRAMAAIEVIALRHREAKRRNIPTAEFESVMRKEDKSPVRVAYERRNRDLDPQLVWRGKDEQDWSDLVVAAPPLYIQEKVHPKVIIDDLKRETKERAEESPGATADLFADFNGLKGTEAADRILSARSELVEPDDSR